MDCCNFALHNNGTILIREHNRHETDVASGESVVVADESAKMLARNGTLFLWMRMIHLA